jgi:hypothetical protein
LAKSDLAHVLKTLFPSRSHKPEPRRQRIIRVARGSNKTGPRNTLIHRTKFKRL